MCPINPSKQDVEQVIVLMYIIQIEYTCRLIWFRWKTTALFESYFLLLINDVAFAHSRDLNLKVSGSLNLCPALTFFVIQPFSKLYDAVDGKTMYCTCLLLSCIQIASNHL